MQTNPPQSIYVVEDSPAIRQRLADLIATIPNARVVGEADEAPRAVADILALRPQTVLLDLDLGTTNGLQVLRGVHGNAPEISFVVLSNHSEPQYRAACRRAGASYFLDKSSQFDSVRTVLAEIAVSHH